MIQKFQFIFYIISISLSFCELARRQTRAGFYPEQVHISLGEKADEMTITWVTLSTPGIASSVFYGENKENLDKSKSANSVTFYTNRRPITVHWTTLSQLKLEQTYYYMVGCCDFWSQKFHFRTLSNKTDWSPKLIIYGDLGVVNARILPALFDEALNDDNHLVIHAGDLAYDLFSNSGRTGDAFFNMMEPIASQLPFMTAPGNHEYMFFIGDNGMNYKQRLKMPGGNNDYYTFTAGPALFVIFSTEVFSNRQEKTAEEMLFWLEEVLTEANKNRDKRPWIIAVGHKPIYCTLSAYFRCTRRRTVLEDIFFKHGVDLIFAGHNHNYERTYPVFRNEILTENLTDPYKNPRAPIYIVTGAAGNREGIDAFSKNNVKGWCAVRISDFGYTKMLVKNQTHLLIQQLDVVRQVVDELWIEQHKHGSFLNSI